jgi:twitching motility protein PilT
MVSESARDHQSAAVPRADHAGRCLTMEILMNNPAVGNLIRGKTFMLPECHLCEAGLISPEEALFRAEDKSTMRHTLGFK